MAKKTGLCRLYQNGSCRFGNKCKFSHESSSNKSENTSGPSSARGTSSTNRDGALLEWKRLLKGSPSTQLTVTAVAQFFKLGLGLMDGDVGASQEAIRHLAHEEGLAFVKAALDRQVPQAGDINGFTKQKVLTTVLVPLFRWVTHSRVVDSAVLEQEVSVLFNFMLGVGGRRMTTSFDFISGCLESWTALKITDPTRMEMIELSLNVLSKILECNTANVINEAFDQVATKFVAFLSSDVDDSDDIYSRLQAARYMDYINRRLGVGHKIKPYQERRPEPVLREQFVLRRDLPGELSAGGPRHDNDHADITKISIMPSAQEIMSPRAEYLPTTDSRGWHVPGIEGRVDREFRLLREDTVGQLRDTVHNLLETTIRNPGRGAGQQARNSTRTYVYNFPVPKKVSFDNQSGLEILVEFAQPQSVHKMNLKQRQDWWEHCKRLQDGALVCVVDATGSVLFFEVSDSTLRTGDEKKDKQRRRNKQQDDEKDGDGTKQKKPSLADDERSSFVSLRLVDSNQETVTETLRWYRPVDIPPRRYLVEFPGVLLASFKHTLQAMQEISKQPNIPFTDLIAPVENTSQEAHVNPPLYARKPRFTYDLKCIAKDGEPLELSARDIQQPSALELVSSRTMLDATQSAAFLDALSREMALVQGPPGTGKSFTGEKIIKTLIANKKKAALGPILCVCYTNHALDQLLEHLLDAGTRGIIRIGSQSKSERIRDLNLRTVSQTVEQTKEEKQRLWERHGYLKDQVREATESLQTLEKSDSWKSVKAFLSLNYPNHHRDLFGHLEADEEGWEQVVHNPDRLIGNWLNGGRRTNGVSRPVEILKKVRLSDMTHTERRDLHHAWMREIRDPLIKDFVNTEREFAGAKDMRDRVRRDVDLRCLQEANIVGVTTTGLARNLDLLRKLRCKVLVCEEAGEVLEAHLFTALLPSVEHAILIGDHLQLRPQIQNYDLQSNNPRGEKYSLDMSLFERLVKPPHDNDIRLPLSVLHTQRRMHPSISELIRSTLYPHLDNGENVLSYPEVVGMKKRLFWLHHENLEVGASNEDPNSTSHSNTFEIEMTVALVSHLVRQGEYGPDDIAVLTPYLGQLVKLRRRMESMFEISMGDRDLEDLDALGEEEVTPSPDQATNGPKPVSKTTLLRSLRLATVDNFQGEEAKVIVISLVRSNPQNKCGFLNTPNRINVLLSRAKHGMYMIGNSNTYGHVPMWSSVIDILRANGNFGRSLELQCPRHPDTSIAVAKPDDFLIYSPESGCTEPCDKRLQCGHKCGGRCHSELLHNAFMCLEKCQRLKKGCTHSCPWPCGQKCRPKCQTPLTNIKLELPCGHVVNSASCWESRNPQAIECQQMVATKVPGCGHTVNVACHGKIKIFHNDYKCVATCGQDRECGHKCKRECQVCNTRQYGDVVYSSHETCQQVCGRKYTTCRHSCRDTCHGSEICSPCQAPCEVRCSHSGCSKKCNEPCVPCAEAQCASGCAHSQCTMPCAAPCDFIPCSKRCGILLSCGHQCPSVCGESCPDAKYCQVCGPESVKSAVVDFIEGQEYHEVNLDLDPCVFPDCGHFMVTSSMDGLMDMAAHYDIDPMTGNHTAIRASSQPFSMDEVKLCASCRGPLRNVGRYGRIVRRAMLDEATKKFITWSVGTHLKLANTLLAEQERLEATQGEPGKTLGPHNPVGPAAPRSSDPSLQLMLDISRAAGRTRYLALVNLWRDISSFTHEVQLAEQPFQRVADMVMYANQQHQTRGEFVFDESVLQVTGSVLAAALLLKCELAVLSDFQELRRDGKAADQYVDIKLDIDAHLEKCLALVNLARNSKLPRQEVEGHIYFAQFCGVSRTFSEVLDVGTEAEQSKKNEERKEQGLAHTAEASRIIAERPSLGYLAPQVEAVEGMLHDEDFCKAATADEMREVYRAMATEFSGTGHWYTCRNGHPFTVGECGMPMQEARCPECGEPVGGTDHSPAAGVQRAEDIEQLGRDVQGLRL